MNRPHGLDHAVTIMPISFYVPPNGAGADYIAETNFRGFVAYGFRACWLGSGSDDPDADCNLPRPVTRSDVRHLRGSFLSYLERTIAMLWSGDLEKDATMIDFGNNGESVEFNEENANELMRADWYVTPQDDALMMSLELTGCDASTLWMSYDAIKDRRNVLAVLREAHEHVRDKTIHPGVLCQIDPEAQEPRLSLVARTDRIVDAVRLMLDACNVGDVSSLPSASLVVVGKDRLRDLCSLIEVHTAIRETARGALWKEDPDFPRQDWRDEVDNDDTLLGYWDWVAYRREVAADDAGEDESQ